MFKSNPKNNKHIYKKRHYYTYINEKKPTPLIYCLQSLQGQLCGTHSRIFMSKLVRELVSFIFAGTISQILVPK